MQIRFIAVGGTIDKVYFDKLSEYQIGPPGVELMLQELPLAFEYTVESVLRKDSLDMDADDRRIVCAAVERAPEAHIVITHGTDTMIETARRISPDLSKTIVFTGAMQPANFRQSDAMFNVGMAVGVVLSRPPGVYIAMNGQVFHPDRCVKNRQKGLFEATN